VHQKSGAGWVIIQSTPVTKSVFLKNLLEKRFPSYRFSYQRFAGFKKAAIKLKKPDGVIAELKMLSSASLKTFDLLIKGFKDIPIILIVSPTGFQLLNQKRKKQLHSSLVALSETKSLDYLIQLPRLIEEVGRKKRLKAQNERLQRLMEKRFPQINSFDPARNTNDPSQTREVLGELMRQEDRHSQCGLKITLRRWTDIKTNLGDTAQGEVVDLLSRMIQSVVRNSDRVLRAKENEFLIFLSNTDRRHLSKCKERLEQALSSLKIQSNQRERKIPFSISSMET
jgi:PleD family two-component response regulator